MGSSLSPVVINVYMEFFKDMVMSVVCKPALWLNTWMTLLSSGSIVLRLSTFFYIVSVIQGPLSNLLRKHVNGHLPFLDVLVVKKEGSLTITVHRKPTHTGRYLRYNF